MTLDVRNYQLSLSGQPLFSPVSFSATPGKVVAITGPSGSGKSTILADLSGILPASFESKGTIEFHQQDLRPIPIEKRKVGILFQEDLLFPHLNVYQNLAFGLPRELSTQEKKRRICDALSEAELTGYDSRDIATLSGGQRSRVALLRTLLSEPELILLDEPFSKLDKELRIPFREWVYDHILNLNIPTVLVTHDDDDIPAGSTVVKLETTNA
jgi:putative thiamine transport system ATP-binding protein